ncbi:Thermophilic serine proteinase [Tolypocladium ophioglossoides CBS 100239]|uniref:Thermophilic serine proteinase n=1 Tax=Tolypocladium ophioglossoides (strain CBS 100239) TaxID=1163406 RepID=A0A0L0NFQ0_TOLOC|nr:Thermophilic serine proteinase [Tolypocladium ophioglossoides CBS 100239]
MRLSRLWSVVHLVFGAVLATTKHQARDEPDRLGSDATGDGATQKYIIEVEKGFSIAKLARHAPARALEAAPYYREFNCSGLFSGLVIEEKTENFDTLQSIDGIINAWPARVLPLPPVTHHPPFAPQDHPLNYSMHRWTGVDKLHDAGIRGRGVKVAVIDTGVDYTHQALGGCFGPGCKVTGGYDLVGNTWDSRDELALPKIPHSDPMDRTGHGTHVAGIVAAKTEWLVGVAPEAELLAYKVFSDKHGTTEEVLIQAFCDAYSAGADVITSSVNMENGFNDGPWAVVASRIVERGVVVTISAGNDGMHGPFASGSASNGHGVLSVAAVKVTGSWKNSTVNENQQPMAAFFTSWGPTNELLLKPDVGAPGMGVISTVLNQQFEALDGTSMSAPYIAGVAALYIGKHGGRDVHGPGFAEYLAKRIISSGRSVAWPARVPRQNETSPPFQVGTGLVDAQKVLQYTTLLSFEPFALLDTELFKPEWTVDIANMGEHEVTYSFELEPQAAVEIYNGQDGIKSLIQIQPSAIVPNVSLPEPQVVSPGQQKAVTFTFAPLKNVDDDMLPLYGGKIWVKGSNGEELCIPYGGAACDTEKAFDTMFQAKPAIKNKNNDLSFNTQKDPADYIHLTAILGYSCVHLRWDIFDGDWNEELWRYPPRAGTAGYVGSATTFRDSIKYRVYTPAKNDKNDTVAFPRMRVARGFMTHWWFGKLANGTQIAPGNYTMRFAALRPYGNPHLSDHWDAFEFPGIRILPYNGTNSTEFQMRKRR